MGRYRSRKRSRSSSSSTSSDDFSTESRRATRVADSSTITHQPMPSTSRSYTPPVSQDSDKISRLENLVERLIESQAQNSERPRFFAKSDCIPEFSPGNPNLSAKKVPNDLNQCYYFDCWVNGIPKQSYVDTGCGAVLLKQEEADSMRISYTPSSLYVFGYGGSKVKVLGKTIIRLKVDQVELDVEVLVVPNDAQIVAVMVGQSFVNNDNVTMIASGTEVRILPADVNISKVLGIPPSKIPLTTALIAVTSQGAYDGDVYIQGNFRPLPCKDHYVGECVTNAQDGYVTITNISHEQIVIVPSTKLFNVSTKLLNTSTKLLKRSISFFSRSIRPLSTHS
ncbi:hypothetical protein NQ318_010227 [Aromia moschata]|uniref:Uncharacterized protein n=1 Tax=Aromia moschata TaxID=1265417 RepID=A0AAV8X786_9CUCU|nr:hypothetical protein NQ318_010227 [Aromia moschata]